MFPREKEITGNQGNEQDGQNDVTMTSIGEGIYGYANGEKLSKFSVDAIDGKQYATLGLWIRYGEGPYYSWDSDEEDTIWVSADYEKK